MESECIARWQEEDEQERAGGISRALSLSSIEKVFHGTFELSDMRLRRKFCGNILCTVRSLHINRRHLHCSGDIAICR